LSGKRKEVAQEEDEQTQTQETSQKDEIQKEINK